MTFFLQVIVFSALLAYLWQCRAYMHRRSRANWADLTSQPGFASVFSDIASLGIAEISAFNQEAQVNSLGFRALWQSFKEARMAMEMADYAERNSTTGYSFIDPVTLASVRRSAMQRRISSLEAMVKHIFPS